MAHTLDARLLQLSPRDNIAVARGLIEAGVSIDIDGRAVRVATLIPTGHKIAIREVRREENVIKYGASIGSATRDIRPGDYVHTHNLASDYLPTFTRGTEEN